MTAPPNREVDARAQLARFGVMANLAVHLKKHWWFRAMPHKWRVWLVGKIADQMEHNV